jgi:adenylosuccinate lyase
MLARLKGIVAGLRIGREAIARNLATYGPFAATEPLLMALVKAGADRQEMHEHIRTCSMAAWVALQRGEANPLADLLAAEPRLTTFLPPETIRGIIGAGADVGDAPARSRALAQMIREGIETRFL